MGHEMTILNDQKSIQEKQLATGTKVVVEHIFSSVPIR